MSTAGRQALHAQISHEALRINLDALRTGVEPGGTFVADLRRDAWGHGAEAIAETLRACGVTTFTVDAPQVAAETLETDAALIALDSYALFGLPQGGIRTDVPVMRLCGRVLSLKRLAEGEGVSYGYTHRAQTDTIVALVTGGYAQGIVRSLGNRAHVAIGANRYPVVGRVAMDVCVVDVGAQSRIVPGDEVVFFGDPELGHPGLAEWSLLTGMDSAELAGVIGQHVQRLHSIDSSERPIA